MRESLIVILRDVRIRHRICIRQLNGCMGGPNRWKARAYWRGEASRYREWAHALIEQIRMMHDAREFEILQINLVGDETWFRVRHLVTGQESSLMRRDECEEVIRLACVGGLLGSFML